MAFTVTARQHVNTGTTSGQTGTSSSATPTADSLLLVFYGAENDNHATAAAFQTPTGGGWTYTQQDKVGDTTAFEWNGTSGFRIASALYSAPIGGSPGAHTVVADAYSTTNVGFYAIICCDITGHNTGAPIVNTTVNGANIPTASDTAAGTVTLDATPSVGNLVVVWFQSGADTGGSPASPTAGVGKTFTAITVHSTSGFTTSGAWYRIWDGTESNTITCSDLGQQVGSYTAIAVEVAASGAVAVAPDGRRRRRPGMRARSLPEMARLYRRRLATDTVAAGSAFTVDQTDLVGLADSAILDQTKDFTDSAGLTDGTALTVSPVLTDSAGLTDTSLAEPSKLVAQTDSAGLTDSAVLNQSKAVTDSAGLTDAAAFTQSKVLTDDAGLTDTSLVESGKAIAQTDSAGLTDSQAFSQTRVLSDSTGLTDAASLTASKGLTDSAGLTDAASVGILRALAATDSAGLTDATVLFRTAVLTDMVGLADAAAFSQLRGYTDSAGLTDAATVTTVIPIPPFVPRPSGGVTPRPGSATTPRPSGGTITRAASGLVPRPASGSTPRP